MNTAHSQAHVYANVAELVALTDGSRFAIEPMQWPASQQQQQQLVVWCGVV